jgi:hypothetical protein
METQICKTWNGSKMIVLQTRQIYKHQIANLKFQSFPLENRTDSRMKIQVANKLFIIK